MPVSLAVSYIWVYTNISFTLLSEWFQIAFYVDLKFGFFQLLWEKCLSTRSTSIRFNCHASRLKKHIFFIYSINFHKFLWTGVDNTIATTGNAVTGLTGTATGLYYFWSICRKPLYREKIQFFWKHNSNIWCSRLTGGLTYVLKEGVVPVIGLYFFRYFYKL